MPALLLETWKFNQMPPATGVFCQTRCPNHAGLELVYHL